MPEQFDPSQAHRQHEEQVRQPANFQEVPGEAEADAVRDAFLKNAGSSPADVASALSVTDSATRSRAVSRLQQERGNAYIQRVVAEARGTPGRMVGRSQPEMVDEVLQRKGSGSALPEGTRQQMEGFFGADLGGVRVHTDSNAAALSQELNAQAFTVGSDVFFSEGKYNPSSSEGQGLLAHEVTHVGQQGGFRQQGVQRQQIQREAEEEEPQAQTAEPAAGPAPDEEEASAG